MKLQCPHCGVKGSAEDSYSGRKVKCPKCQGLFELKPDMALEIAEEPALLSGLSSTSTESALSLSEAEIPISTDEDSEDTGQDGALTTKKAKELAEIDEDIAEPETKTVPPAEQEEALDWEDIASENDLQLAEEGTGEEHDDILEDSPADISSLQDEFETPAGDIGLTFEEETGIGEGADTDIWDEVEEDPAESEAAGLMDESPSFDPDDSLSPEQDLKDDETPSDDLGLTLEEETGIADGSDADIWDEVEEDPAESEAAGLMDESPSFDPDDSLSPEQDLKDDETPSDDLGLTLEEETGIKEGADADVWDEVEEDPAVSEVSGLMDESPLLDPVNSQSPEQETDEDLLESDENTANDEGDGSLAEVQLVEEADEIELHPYGIDKEQCWQCGKKGSLGEAFVEKDGRSYCTDCAPVEAPEELAGTNENLGEGDTVYAQGLVAGTSDLIDDAPKGSTNKFTIGDAIREAWANTKGAKGAIWAGSAIMYLVILIIVAGGAFLLPSLGTDLTNISGLVSNMLFQAVTNIFSVLFTAGLFFMGLKKVAGDPISWKMIFKGFSCSGKLIVAAILQFILVSIGFLLLVLPGIYLIVGYAMTLPLIVDKGLSPWQAMEMSRKAVHKIWWKVAGLFVVMGLIFVVSLIPLGIGLIWTWPMFIILAGVVYHYLFGDEKKVS